MIRVLSVIFIVWLTTNATGQKDIKRQKLPAELREISGLESYNDSTLVAINDGGNEPELYFLDLKGRILKKTRVFNAVNTDWEDLAKDNNGHLYIADAGNNLCNRRELCIWKVDLDLAYSQDSVSAEELRFSYADRPDADSYSAGCSFDSEALFWHNDSLNILTKNTTRPRKNYWDNGTAVYRIPDDPGVYAVKSSRHLWTGGDNRIRHQVTAADMMEQELVVLTYGKVFFYDVALTREFRREPLIFRGIKQREALVLMNDQSMIIAAERHPLLGGPYLYTLKWK